MCKVASFARGVPTGAISPCCRSSKIGFYLHVEASAAASPAAVVVEQLRMVKRHFPKSKIFVMSHWYWLFGSRQFPFSDVDLAELGWLVAGVIRCPCCAFGVFLKVQGWVLQLSVQCTVCSFSDLVIDRICILCQVLMGESQSHQ